MSTHSPVCYTPLHSPSTCTQRMGWHHFLLLSAHWPLAPSPPCLELLLPVSWPPQDRSSQLALHRRLHKQKEKMLIQEPFNKIHSNNIVMEYNLKTKNS